MARLETKQMTTPSSPNLEQFARECAEKWSRKLQKAQPDNTPEPMTTNYILQAIREATAGMVSREELDKERKSHMAIEKESSHKKEQLYAQLDKAQKDKERLDWFQKLSESDELIDSLMQQVEKVTDIRQAIDSAIQQQKGSGDDKA